MSNIFENTGFGDKEHVDDEKLEQLAIDYADNTVEHTFDETNWVMVFDAFKAGYNMTKSNYENI